MEGKITTIVAACVVVIALLVSALFTTRETQQKVDELNRQLAVLKTNVEEQAPDEEQEEAGNAAIEKNWQGKKVLVIGDSISTDYYGNYTKWVTVLKNQGYFPADTQNDSIHGTGFVATYDGDDRFVTRLAGVEDKDTYDLVVIFGGINDAISSKPMGEKGGDKETEFKPAVDYFFDYLVNNFTQARIVVLSPLLTKATGVNSAGHRYVEYIDYVKAVAKHYCLPVLNLTEESGFCPFVESFRDMWTYDKNGEWETGDGVHPNAEYEEKYLAPMIKNFLNQFI